ncbi:hydrolase, partial [Georgenia sp. 10Sc9-8]|nr:hydrolase [Georgenia halotolerans]
QRAVAAIGRAAAAGARLVVLPEYSSGWARRITPALAEPVEGPFVSAVREAAREHGTTVLVGTVLPATDDVVTAAAEQRADRAANVTLAIGPAGELVGSYTKAHLFDAFTVRESEHLVPGAVTGPGAEPLVVDVGGLQVGVLTCYDLRFPESARRLVDAGAQVIAVGAAWASGPGKAEQLGVLVQARAIENGVYVLLASQSGPGRTGRTAVVDPRGTVLARLGDGGAGGETEIATAELEPELVSEVRDQVPALRHRRFAVVPRP